MGLDKITGIWDTLDMGYYSRRRRSSTVFHAAHNAVAARASFDPSLKPDSALISDRQAKRPNYKALASIPADWDYIVLDVPFGKRGSTEVRQWAKTIGARWNTSHKEWRITASRVDSDRLAIINSLRLYLNHTTKAAPIFLARIGSPSCRVILQVPFEEKDTAKGDGARWDTIARKWYFTMQGNLAPALKQAIRAAFLNLADKEVLKSFRVEAFAATDDKAYDVLRETAAILKLDIAKMK